MADKPYTGLTASIEINENAVAYINNVTLSPEREIIEILQFGAEYKEKLPAIKNWTASAEGTVTFATDSSQQVLWTNFEGGTAVTLKIKLSDTTYFVGNALISSLEITGAPDAAMTFTAEFEGTGGITATFGK